MIVGHQEVTQALSRRLPPVSVITGPPSVGKRLIAAHSAMEHNVARTDFMQVAKVTTQEVLKVKNFMSTAPHSKFKFALLDMDNSSNAAKDDLLALLEEPAAYARFSLIGSNPIPSTLYTRGEKFSVGLLRPSELANILKSKGIAQSQISKVDKLGRVDLALKACADFAIRISALNVLQAVESMDLDLFVQSYKSIDDNAANLIITMLQESSIQNFKSINPEALGKFASKNIAMRVLASWMNFSEARPSIAVRVALESIMKG